MGSHQGQRVTGSLPRACGSAHRRRKRAASNWPLFASGLPSNWGNRYHSMRERQPFSGNASPEANRGIVMAISRGLSCIVAGVLFCPIYAFAADPLPRAKPEDAGMSSERLAEIGKALNAEIARGQMPGAVVAIGRKGKLVFFEAFGYRDKTTNAPMTTDAIFNIATMTKPMTAVAALQLYEQGRLLMDDPLGKYFPKFGDTQVAVMDATKQNIIDKVPAARKITMQDLFRHTSGLIYGGRGATAVHKLFPEGSGGAAAAMTGAEFLDKLSSLPVLHQPGAVWDYGFGLDVLGLAVESLSEQSLGQYLQERVITPLGSVAT